MSLLDHGVSCGLLWDCKPHPPIIWWSVSPSRYLSRKHLKTVPTREMIQSIEGRFFCNFIGVLLNGLQDTMGKQPPANQDFWPHTETSAQLRRQSSMSEMHILVCAWACNLLLQTHLSCESSDWPLLMDHLTSKAWATSELLACLLAFRAACTQLRWGKHYISDCDGSPHTHLAPVLDWWEVLFLMVR